MRPIDFVHREMVITYPFESVGNDKGDATYLPPDEQHNCKQVNNKKESSRQATITTNDFGNCGVNYI